MTVHLWVSAEDYTARYVEVVVNADLARLADPPPSRVRRAVMALAFGNLLAAVLALTGDGPIAYVLAGGNAVMFVAVAVMTDRGWFGR